MAEPTLAPLRVSLRQPADRLLAHSLSAFHTIGLMVLLLAIAHRSDGLGVALGGLGSGVGSALYLALWVTTSWTTAEALRLFPLADAESWSWFAFVKQAVIGGCINGVAFLWAMALVLAFKEIAAGLGEISWIAGLGIVSYLVLASLVAGLVGAVIGLVFGLIDRCLLGVGLALARNAVAEA